MSELDIILDNSRQNLTQIPATTLQMPNLKMLYLQQNSIIALPNDFFQKLPLLTWLDLRNNSIYEIPKGIVNHQHLENLLLSDNRLQSLPNEVGTLPKLKVLQIANNPLLYPNSKVVAEGTSAVVKYLKDQYEIESALGIIEKNDVKGADPELSLESQIRVMADYCNELFAPRVEEAQPLDASLTVKGLSKVHKDDSGIIHKVTSSTNKFVIRSYFDEDIAGLKKASTQTESTASLPSSYKQSFLDKLRDLLDQQEKILQQERNLQALNTWRDEKRNEAMPMVGGDVGRRPPPFATDEDYSTFSREDMRREIDKMIQYSSSRPKAHDVEKLINELVGQLKEMENSYGGIQSSRSEIEEAGRNIMKIMDMHKKIVKLRAANNLTL